MEAVPVTRSPGVVPDSPVEPAAEHAAPERLGYRAAALYVLWAAVAAVASAAGAVPLPAGAGLAAGAAATLGLLLGLGRLPVTAWPGGPVLVLGQSVLLIAWATLYLGLAGAPPGGPVLAVGMYLSAIALALPAASLPALGGLMGATAMASTLTPLLRHLAPAQGAALTTGRLLETLLASLVLTVLLAVIWLAARTLTRAREALQARNAELTAGLERLARRAERDHLTHSYNRQSILEMVSREKARADRSGETLCVCLLDIDHFKDMNDRYGHLAGDRILAAFARRVRGALRTMDTLNSGGLPASLDGDGRGSGPAGRRAFGRVGGEEFIVLLPETSLRGALRCAERVRKAVVRRPFEGLHHVTVSIGIAEYRPGETVSSLIGRADEALYGAKNAGRNRVHCATTDGGPNAIVMPDIPAVS
jgi:GGDEF domain-containing protein